MVLVFLIHMYRRCCLISEKNYIFVRMAEDEDNGRLYTGLDLAFDKDHRARAIKHGEVTILTYLLLTFSCYCYFNKGSF